jgi:hypothetical protein
LAHVDRTLVVTEADVDESADVTSAAELAPFGDPRLG